MPETHNEPPYEEEQGFFGLPEEFEDEPGDDEHELNEMKAKLARVRVSDERYFAELAASYRALAAEPTENSDRACGELEEMFELAESDRERQDLFVEILRSSFEHYALRARDVWMGKFVGTSAAVLREEEKRAVIEMLAHMNNDNSVSALEALRFIEVDPAWLKQFLFEELRLNPYGDIWSNYPDLFLKAGAREAGRIIEELYKDTARALDMLTDRVARGVVSLEDSRFILKKIVETDPSKMRVLKDPEFLKAVPLTEEERMTLIQQAYVSTVTGAHSRVICDDAVRELGKLKHYLGVPISSEAAALIFEHLCEKGAWSEVKLLKEGWGLPVRDDTIQRGLAHSMVNLMAHVDENTLPKWFGHIDVVPNWEKIGQNLPLINIRTLARVPSEKLREHSPWVQMLRRLEKIQGISRRDEHDPWSNELQPLLNWAVEQKLMSAASEEDAEIFYSFVDEFGALNMPKLFEAFAALKRTRETAALPDAMRQELAELIGEKRLAKLKKTADVLNELRGLRRRFQSELLADKIPDGVDSKIGVELFKALIGKTKWERKTPPHYLIEVWRKTVEARPEVAALPEGYKEHTVSVPLRREETKAGREAREAAETELLKSKEVIEAFHIIAGQSFEGNFDMGNFRTRWETYRHLLLDRVHGVMYKETDSKKIAMLGLFIKELQEREVIERPDEAYITSFMEWFVGLKLGEWSNELQKSEESAVRSFSSMHIERAAPPAHLEALYGEPLERIATRDTVTRVAEFAEGYLKEHYLHEDQSRHDWTNHTPFSEELRQRLLKVWNLEGDFSETVLGKTRTRLRELDEQAHPISDKSTEVAFVPTRGLLRIYSGDIADACSTTRHGELARGKYDGITTITFVTGRDSPRERIRGSVLFVETETPDGKTVLNVRANNPRNDLLALVDPDTLIEQVLTYAVKIAEARDIDCVTVSYDGAAQSSSNRQEVPAYYQKRYGKKSRRVALVNEPETNYNGYPSWDAEGQHPVVVIWERE